MSNKCHKCQSKCRSKCEQYTKRKNKFLNERANNIFAETVSGFIISGKNTFAFGSNSSKNLSLTKNYYEYATKISTKNIDSISSTKGYGAYFDQLLDYQSSLFLKSSIVYSVGNNKYFQLGISNNDENYTIQKPQEITRSGGYSGNCSKISSGSFFSLILLDTGQVSGFGLNEWGQLGIQNDITSKNSNTQSTNNSSYDGTNCIDISAGGGYSLILLRTGQVLSCGNNLYGQLGNTENIAITNPNTIFTPVINGGGYNGTNCEKISTGAIHSVILLEGGKVLTFGDNSVGQLGNNINFGNNTPNETPSEIDYSSGYDGTNCIQISTNFLHTLILLSSGKVLSFGNNSYGQLGRLTEADGDYNPDGIVFGNGYNGSNCIAVSAGATFSLILLSNRKVLSFGNNFFGQLANGKKQLATFVPQIVKYK